MHLVTEAGLRAQANRDAAAEALSHDLFDYLADGPKTPRQLINRFAGPRGDVDLVQEAMWVLLDKSRAEVTEDRQLSRTA